MNPNQASKDDDQTLAPEMLIDKTLYHVLQLDKEDVVFLSAIHDENYKNLIFSLLYK